MKLFKKIVVLVIMLALSMSIFAGCKKDNDKNKEKPDIHAAFMNYEACDKKKSIFEAGIKFTMFSSDGQPISFGQKLTADRILNNDKIYIEASIGSFGVSDNFIDIVNSINTIMGLIPNMQSAQIDPEVIAYINAERQFVGKLGYDGAGTYNAKGDYIKKGETPDYLDDDNKPYWVATDEASIINIQNNLGYNGGISPKDFLMYSTMIDLDKTAGWIKNDSASLYYDELQQAYLYSITTAGAKLKGLILDSINESAENFDEEQYAEDLRLYAEIIPTVSKWIKTPDSTVNAQVDKEGRLKSFSSSMRIDIDINVEEMWQILALIMPKENKAMIDAASFFLSNMFRSSAGGKGIWTIRIDLTTDETFYYDEQSVSLSNVDPDMFLAITEKNADRFAIIIDADSRKK